MRFIFQTREACGDFWSLVCVWSGSIETIIHTKNKRHREGAFVFGADDGNRTRVFGLGSGHSAIELHLHLFIHIIIVQKALIVKPNDVFFLILLSQKTIIFLNIF